MSVHKEVTPVCQPPVHLLMYARVQLFIYIWNHYVYPFHGSIYVQIHLMPARKAQNSLGWK